jgi:hypothetical protein
MSILALKTLLSANSQVITIRCLISIIITQKRMLIELLELRIYLDPYVYH